MHGSFVCPHCRFQNKCACDNCKPYYLNLDPNNNIEFVICDYQTNDYVCCSCSKHFNEQDSLDIEWDIMIENIAKTLTKEICLDWIKFMNLGSEYRQKFYPEYRHISDFEKKHNASDFSFGMAFKYHFKMHHKNVDIIKLLRDEKLNQILE